MATRKKLRARSRKATVTLARTSATTSASAASRPAATSSTATGATGSASASSSRASSAAVRPPLEVALGDFTRELRAAIDATRVDLDAARAEIATLRADLDALRKRYDKHTHTYTGVPGGGGFMWFSLGHLRNYLGDDDDTHLDAYGVWCRGKSEGSGTKPSTDLPSA